MNKNHELPVEARYGMTKSFYAGVQESYKDVLEEIREMKETFEANEKEMFVLNSLEKSIFLSVENEKLREQKAMNIFNVIEAKESILKRVLKSIFNKNADNSSTLDGQELPAEND